MSPHKMHTIPSPGCFLFLIADESSLKADSMLWGPASAIALRKVTSSDLAALYHPFLVQPRTSEVPPFQESIVGAILKQTRRFQFEKSECIDWFMRASYRTSGIPPLYTTLCLLFLLSAL
jgi:hypothetical protein